MTERYTFNDRYYDPTASINGSVYPIDKTERLHIATKNFVTPLRALKVFDQEYNDGLSSEEWREAWNNIPPLEVQQRTFLERICAWRWGDESPK